ncbi:putative leucine zipper-ef-hand containing transmembrane protein [Corchorus olitorius]|uniref:Leucine zipper-ef-hand containing transmembrane protein n=1 Tax=Corchorus olitorius TaxID=93759 RepID=A0A1R3G3H0_9ROSI|nr:putative leucine zipper-ef-hand containing transmembrane protein [Corchorus olitorius]
MASRAILRRKRFISDYLNTSSWSVQALQYLGPPSQKSDSRGYRSNADHPSEDFNHVKNLNVHSVAKQDLLGFPGLKSFSYRCQGISVLGLGSARFQFSSPLSVSLMSYSVRNASTATAKQPEPGSDDEGDEELVAKRRKEASAEECDQAVEGLTTAKAKAKAKRLQDSKKVAKSVLRRVWATILGIGPALRAVASMSR